MGNGTDVPGLGRSGDRRGGESGLSLLCPESIGMGGRALGGAWYPALFELRVLGMDRLDLGVYLFVSDALADACGTAARIFTAFKREFGIAPIAERLDSAPILRRSPDRGWRRGIAASAG